MSYTLGTCPICKQYDTNPVLGYPHRCKPQWEVAVQDEEPDDREDFDAVRADDGEDAAERAAADFEQYGAAYDHDQLIVWARPAWDHTDEDAEPPAWLKFEVECRMVREYMALEVRP